MKYSTLLIAAAMLSFASCNTQNEETAADTEIVTEAETETTENETHLGEKINEEGAISVAELEKQMEDKDSVAVKVRAEIIESCKKKGCWADVKLSDGTAMKVTFKDYGFFLPIENLEGKEVVLEGVAKREVVSVDDLRHYAEDGGKSAEEIAKITEPEERMLFVANGAILEE